MTKSQTIPGTPVTYYGVIKANGEKFDPFITKIASEPWDLGHGETVCKIEGKSGGVSIKHLEEIK